MTYSQSRGYPKEYRGPCPIAEQITLIAEVFSLDPRPALALARRAGPDTVAMGAEGVFALPRLDKVAHSYEEAIELVLEILESQHRMRIDSERIGFECVAPSFHSALAHTALVDAHTVHDSDIFLVPAQFGVRFAGQSVQNVRREVESSRIEFGLGLFEVLCMLVTHPERMAREDALSIDVPGDDYYPLGRKTAREALVVDRIRDEIVISSVSRVVATRGAGSATGFLR